MELTITGFIIICDQTGTFVAGHVYHDETVANLECETLSQLRNWYTSRLALTYSVKPFTGTIRLTEQEERATFTGRAAARNTSINYLFGDRREDDRPGSDSL